MSRRKDLQHVFWKPLAIWASLIALLIATAAYASMPGMPGPLFVNLGILGLQISLVVLFFMQMRDAASIVRLAAIAGLVWASFLFLFSFADFMTR